MPRTSCRVALAVLLGMAAGGASGAAYVSSQQHNEVQQWLAQASDLLPDEIEKIQRANQAIALLIQSSAAPFTPQDLQRWAPQLLATLPAETALSIAPQGVLAAIVPTPASNGWRGINLLTHPLYRTSSRQALQQQSSVIQGPVPLLKGGVGLIVRTPVFAGSPPRFWGFVHGLGPWTAWLQQLEQQARSQSLPMRVAVELRDGEQKTFRSPAYGELAARGTVGRTVAIKGGAITLAAAPAGPAPDQLALLVLAPLSGGTLAGGLALALCRRRQQQQLQAMARYQALFDQSLDGVAVLNRRGRFIEANTAIAELFGVESSEAFLALTPAEFSPPCQPDGRPSAAVAAEQLEAAFRNGAANFEYLHRRLDRDEPWLGLVALQRIELEREPVLIARVRDITVSRRYEQRIEALAYRDPLTGLANRAATHDWLEQQLQQRPDQRWGLINLDLDDFRSINQVFGPQQGDELLCHGAQRLSTALPAGAWLARLDSDEFLVVLPLPEAELGDTCEALLAWGRTAQAAIAAAAADLAAPLPRVSASAGCSCSAPGEIATAAALLQQANTALQQAKQGGRGGLAAYSPQLAVALEERLALEEALERALAPERADQAFQLVYQPQVNRAGRVVRAEALLRFRSADGQAVPPDRFIPLAERNGQIHRLGAWVLNAAFRQQALWRDAGLSLVPLSVNVSARQFDEISGIPPLLEQLRALQQRYALAPRWIMLELTETALLHEHPGMGRQLGQLAAAGFKISLDDFGSGYSSLRVLRDYPVAQVKIDKSFVDPVSLDSRSCAIVQALVAITRARRMDLVAEGVERRDQRDTLIQLGVRLFQGFLFAPGLTAAAFADLLADPDQLSAALGQRAAAKPSDHAETGAPTTTL